MIEGVLCKTQKGWVVKHNRMVHTPVGNHDYKVTLEDSYIDTHPDHHMWLKMFGEQDMQVCFEVETIAIGTDEHDVMDADVAKLKSCVPSYKEYAQD